MADYKLVRSKRKSIALIIRKDGSLEVRAPRYATLAQIEAVLAERADWIRKGQERNRALWKMLRPKTFQEGEEFLYLGKPYRLRIAKGQREALNFNQGFHLSEEALKSARAVFEKWYRQQARRVLTERVSRLAKKHGFTYTRVRITGARTRWGSCSTTGALNFTWRLVMAPPEAIDYVVIHELAHLKEKNHSKKYWEIVRRLMPEYQKQRQWFRKNGQGLNL